MQATTEAATDYNSDALIKMSAPWNWVRLEPRNLYLTLHYNPATARQNEMQSMNDLQIKESGVAVINTQLSAVNRASECSLGRQHALVRIVG